MTCDECLEHEWISNNSLQMNIVTASNEVVILSNTGVACDDENTEKENEINLSFQEKCVSIISASTLDKVESFHENEKPPLLTAISQNDVNQNICCDTQSGQDNTFNNGVEMDFSTNQPLSYESDKENEELVDKMVQSGKSMATLVNGQDFEKSQQQLTDLTGSISFNNLNTFYKSHKRLSSDIFPNSDHQKLIVATIVASNSSSNLSSLKKYTSESAMSTTNTGMNSSSGDQELRFTPNRNDSNNNLMNDHSSPIQVPIVVESSNGAVSVNNGETSPPSTPNKKIYLSTDDSFCHFGSSTSEASKLMFTKLLSSPNSTSPNATTTQQHNSPNGACNIVRSVSMERLDICTRVETSNSITRTIPCFDSKADQVFNSELPQNYQFSSSTTISSSSTSSSLSSLVSSSINFTRVHRQMSSQVSSPGC